MNSQENPSSCRLRETAAGPQHIVVVDSRDPSTAPLRDLLARAHGLGAITVATTLEHALEALAPVSKSGVLTHLGVDPRAGGGGGAVIAVELRRRAPSLPIIVYTGNPNPRHAPAFSWLRPAIPIVGDAQLVSDLDGALRWAARVADRADELRCAVARVASRVAVAGRREIPPGFRIQRFEAEIERASVLLAVQSRATGHEAAAAIGRSERSLARMVAAYGLQPPRSSRPSSSSAAPRMAWVHSPAVGAKPALSAEAGDVEVVRIAPSELSPRRLEPADISCALVRVDDVAAAIDAWKLAHAPRDIPWAMYGSVTTPLAILLSSLGLSRPLDVGDDGIADVAVAVARAGAACRDIARAFSPVPGLPEVSSGELLNLNRIVERACDGVVLAALDIAGSETKAAPLVGLPPRTFAYRAKQARTRRERTSAYDRIV